MLKRHGTKLLMKLSKMILILRNNLDIALTETFENNEFLKLLNNLT